MKVFISWSGDQSKKFAEVLRDWLPGVLQAVRPYFTPSDIEKGTRWHSEIAKELETTEVGILCVTRDNIHSEWIMFEAGALSKSLDKSNVCPVLFGIQNTDLAGPLKQFQTTEFEKEEIKKLVSVINNKLGENKLPNKVLSSAFDKWWPDLETQINEIVEELDEDEAEPIRSDRDLLEEILGLSRMQSRVKRPVISHRAIMELLDEYISVHNINMIQEGSYQVTLDGLEQMQKALIHIANRYTSISPELDELIEKLGNLSFKTTEQETKDVIVDDDDDLPF